MRLLLVNPSITTLTYDVPPILPPMGLMYIASMARSKGHEVSLFDFINVDSNSLPQILHNKQTDTPLFCYGVREELFLEHINHFRPDLIGLSNIMAVTEENCLRLARVSKQIHPDIPVIVGGTNCIARAKHFLDSSYIDYVYRGEGDAAFIDFLDVFHSEDKRNNIPGICYRKMGNIVISKDIPVLDDLDKNPIPAWDLIDVDKYLKREFPFSFHLKSKTTTMITSRGCSINCIFCSGKKLLGAWRGKSAENTIREALLLKEKYGVEEIQFIDSNISYDRDRFIKLLNFWKKELQIVWAPVGGIYVRSVDEEIVKLMAESGCHSIPFGIEAGSIKIQKYIGKIVPKEKVMRICRAARQQGIWTHGLFVIGFPEETEEDILEILRYSKEADLDSISLFAASPLPGSRLYTKFINDDTFDPMSSRFVGTLFPMSSLPHRKIVELRKQVAQKFFWWKLFREMYPKSILIRLKSPKLWNMIFFIAKAMKRFMLLKKRDAIKKSIPLNPIST